MSIGNNAIDVANPRALDVDCFSLEKRFLYRITAANSSVSCWTRLPVLAWNRME